MAQINPYLYFDGDCEAAFNFYKTVFESDFQYVGRYKDMPPSAENRMEVDGDKIMHIALPISKETVLMGSDVAGEYAQLNVKGSNVQLSVNAETEEEAKRIFHALSAGGQMKMPLEKTFWGALFGMFIDKFGIHWMVNYDYTEQK